MCNIPHNDSLEWRTRYSLEDRGYGTPCWVWQGTNAGSNRSVVSRNLTAHRAFYEDRFGPVPRGLCVYHLCPTPGCVNPEHLRAGTRSEAGRRSHARRRLVRLRALDAARIRELLAEGVPQKEIARRFSVSQSTVSHIKTGKTWKGASL
jgi:hypothetical protein